MVIFRVCSGKVEDLLQFGIMLVGSEMLDQDDLSESLSPHPQLPVGLGVFQGWFEVEACDMLDGSESVVESLNLGFVDMDVQASDGRGMLLRYCSSYVPKFSDSFATDWLNDDASDYSVARRILFDYHPLEPEMWMQLAAKKYPAAFFGGTMQPLFAPYPGMQKKASICRSLRKLVLAACNAID